MRREFCKNQVRHGSGRDAFYCEVKTRKRKFDQSFGITLHEDTRGRVPVCFPKRIRNYPGFSHIIIYLGAQSSKLCAWA